MLECLRSDKAGPWIVAGGVLVGFCLIGAIALLNSPVHERVYHEYATSEAYAQAQEKFEQECSELATIEEVRGCFRNAVKSARETQRAEEDVYAQKQMANWAWWMLWIAGGIGVVSVGVTMVGVYFVRRTLTLTRELFVAEQRPWLSVRISIPESGVVDLGDDYELSINIIMENVGNTPAYNAWPSGIRGVPQNAPIERDSLANDIAMSKRDAAAFGQIIFPKQIVDDWKNVIIRKSNPFFGIRYCLIAGWVKYQFSGSDKIHTTPFLWSAGISAHDDVLQVHESEVRRQPLDIPPD